MTDYKLYVVGANSPNGGNSLTELMDLHKSNPHLLSTIPYVYNGNDYTIYRDYHDTLWASGHNKHFSCCILEKAEHIPLLKHIDYFESKPDDQDTSDSKETKRKQRKQKKQPKPTPNKTDGASQTDLIHIKKICVSVSGYCTFFISQNNKVYGNGNNRKYQLGFRDKESEWWRKGFRYKCEPKNITDICKNLIDIKSAANYSLALRMSDKAVMFLYCNRSKYHKGLQLHEDVFRLIVAYVGQLSDEDCAVYMTGNGRFGWKAIPMFMGKDIIKIECGEHHALALESNGVLWSWGNNRYLQCGPLWTWAEDKTLKFIKNPMEVTYFKDNNIKIKDMKCGWNHNLVIDSKHRVYAFGKNDSGQCGYVSGDASDTNVCHVQPIAQLQHCEVKSVECGANHSYVETMDGKHYLFGKNKENQCVTYDERASVANPYCINAMIKEKTNGTIRKVTLGVDNTQIIVSTQT
eukprot:243805_1